MTQYERDIESDFDMAQECGMTIGQIRRWRAERAARLRAEEEADPELAAARAAQLKQLQAMDREAGY